MKNEKSGIHLNNHDGKLIITPNVTLQDVKEFCEVNLLDENIKYKIFEGVIEHLHSLTSPTDKNDVYRDIMHFIYSKGFDVNKIHFGGVYDNTMLLWDISYGRAISPEASLTLLREFNANPFIFDNANKNALHFLLLKGHEVQRSIVDEILSHKDIKKHINDKTICGDTALHIACARRDEKFITQLLEKGADLNVKNKNGQTPIDMLHLNEKERLEFLSLKKYLDLSCVSNRDIKYLATVDKEIFNSDPQVIEEKIKENSKSQSTVLQDSALSNVQEQDRLFSGDKMAGCADVIRKFKAKDTSDMFTRIGAGIILVFLFGAIIVVGYKHLPEDYKIPAITIASVFLFSFAAILLAAPFLYWAKVNKDKQQKEPLSPLSNVNGSESYSLSFSVSKI